MSGESGPSSGTRFHDTFSVLVCLGPGGVGKTTTAASIGLAAASAGRNVVVLTIDPARRLADAMGVDLLTNEPARIAGPWPGQLWAAMLDPEATFENLVHQHARSEAQATSIIDSRLFRNLVSSLSGTHEYMAGERLRELNIDERFDLVVLDTPPAKQAFDFLDSPGRLVHFIDHPLYRTVLAPHRGVLRAVNIVSQLAVRTIGRVVGAQLLDDAVGFFAAFGDMDEGFRRRADEVDQLLASDATGFVLVTSARPDPISGTRWIAERLQKRGLRPSLLIANRLTPQRLAAPHRLDPANSALDRNLAELAGLAQAESGLIDELAEDLTVDWTVRIDDQTRPVSDLAGLMAIAGWLADAT